MRRELHIFLSAVMFYTRIPCPKEVGHNPEYVNLSLRYLPFIGWIIGGVYGTAILFVSYVLIPEISVLTGLTISILLTGAFHEDGLADVCDGFGGGWTKEKILAIMKDSRLGTYGVVALVLTFAFKFYLVLDLFRILPSFSFVIVIISSHSLSRAMAVVVPYFLSYARQQQESKACVSPVRIKVSVLLIAFLFGMTPVCFLLFLHGWIIVLVILPTFLMTIFLMHYFNKWIGGYTGDCLGATQQVNEIVFLLGTAGLWKFT
jgi:adenosylcobinamide-GDP ribazoletransferase